MMGRSRPDEVAGRIAEALSQDTPVRLDLGGGSRLYLDRPLPFLAVHVGRRSEPVAREATVANAAYLLARNLGEAARIARMVGEKMEERFGTFVVLDIGELARDQLAGDAPYLAPFEIGISGPADKAGQDAVSAFVSALEKIDARYRAPRIVRHAIADDPHAGLARRLPAFPAITVRFAPVYRVPGSRAVYPELRERLVSSIFDASLRAAAHLVRAQTSLAPSTHRALGRRVFLDAVVRADRAMDEIAGRFDFLLAVTPINAEAAWTEFSAADCQRAPTFLYRPLATDVAASKKALFSIGLDRFEDPVLSALYREKQQELDLQLSMLATREDRRFMELGRALYGSVEPRLLKAAQQILADTASGRRGRQADTVDYRSVEKRARAMIARYADGSGAFAAHVEVRDDLPPGLMVSDDRLLISRSTTVAKDRVEALLSHEIGVHLLTYCNGSGHGLRLFRSGLAGYEGAQEGLAVLAEYLAGGMTVARLRLIAARVVACAGMLDGAGFVDTFRTLTKEHGFTRETAFNVALRIHRGGGLAKDAIYLRGLLEILGHLQGGGALDPFWMGKIAARHFAVMQELSTRGLLKAPRLKPQFLSARGAEQRLARLRSGLSPLDLVAA